MNPTSTLPLMRYLRYLPALLLLLLLPLAGSAQITAPPADSAVTVLVQNCNQALISWHPSRRAPRCEDRESLVVIQEVKPGTTTPVPVDGQSYIGLGILTTAIPGSQVAPGQFVVYAGTDSTVTVTNLQGARSYRIDVFAYCSGYEEDSEGEYQFVGPFYSPAATSLATGLPGLSLATPSCQVVPPPTVAASQPQVQVIDCSTAKVTVRRGNGQGRMLVVQRLADGASALRPGRPEQGTVYFPSFYYQQAQPLPRDSWPVSLGPDSSIVVFGLRPGETYRLLAYEYNGALDAQGQPTLNNLQYVFPSDQLLFTVPACSTNEPATPATKARQSDTTTTTARLRWVSGSGTARLVVLRAVNTSGFSLPQQNTPYVPGPYLLGGITRTDAWVVASTTDSTVELTNLAPSSAYQAFVYEFSLAGPFNPLTGLPNPLAGLPTYLLSRAPAQTLILTAAPPDEPLPVTLVRFEAVRVGSAAELRWATAMELNNDFFQVERSADGRRFESVGRVRGAGSTPAPQSYRYLDTTAPLPAGPPTYYRLLQQDLDGKRHYSAVVVLSGPAAQLQVSVWPNPIEAGQQLRLQVPAEWNTPGLQVTIRSLSSAKAVLSAPLAATGQIQLPAGIASGVYQVEVSTPTGQRRTTRLLIR